MITFAATLGFSGAEEVAVYVYLYNASSTISAQLDILQQMAAADLSGAGEFYTKALKRLVSEYKNIRDITEKNAADEQAMLLSALLGEEKYTPAAPDIWLVLETFSSPPVKAEALITLGKIRATHYLPEVIRVLQNVNDAPTADRLTGESIAFGAIVSLEYFRDPSGYLPVFFATTGWYSNWIKDQALRSLPFIATDPTPFILEVIKGTGYNYPAKLTALQTIEKSDANIRNKASVAVAALSEGWKGQAYDPQKRNTLAEMRKTAITMINRYKSNDEAVYPLLERSYNQGNDFDEKTRAVAALASRKTDESARVLSNFLTDLNAKQQSGNIGQEDMQMVREIIPALGQTGRPIGRSALNAVIEMDWSSSIKQLAGNALKQIF